MDANCTNRQRVEWIDFAKGLAILSVIIGHTLNGGGRAAIFSFHMPLFFIFSCITFQCSKNGEDFLYKTERSFKHLVIPAIIMYLLSTIIWSINNYEFFFDYFNRKNFINERILVGVFSSGVIVQVADSKIPAMGMPWFLIVLFVGRTLFDYLNLKLGEKKTYIICVALSILGVFFGKTQWLPLSFDIALAILPFFVIGKQYKKFNVENKPGLKMVIAGMMWLVLLLVSYYYSHTYMELACRRYTLYPLCYVIALVGTLMISELSVLCCRIKKLSKPMSWLGKNSLYILCIHMLEAQLLRRFWLVSDSEYINMICRVVVNIIIFILFMFLCNIVKIYKKMTVA